MNSIRIASLICICLATSVIAAPTEVSTGETSPATSTAESSSTTAPTPVSTADQTSSAPAPATDDTPKAANTTASMAVGATHDQVLNTSSFTCYGRAIGYYGDIERECKVYHFCLLGDYNGDLVYQRISYLCLNETLFDQQALDCVEPSKLTAPCKDSPNFFETSNAILRQAIVGNQMHQGEHEGTTTPKSA